MIAEKLELAIHQYVIIDTLKFEREKYELLSEKQQSVILKLETKVKNLTRISNNKGEHIGYLNRTIRQQKRKLRSGKIERWLFGGGLIILSGILIIH